MINTIKKLFRGALMLAGGILLVCVAIRLWPSAPGTITNMVAASQMYMGSAKTFLRGQPKEELPPDVKTYLDEAQHLRMLVAARNSKNDIWSEYGTWPEVEWVREKSPILNYLGPQVVLQPIVGSAGVVTYQLIGGQLQVLLTDEAGTEKWLDINAPIPAGCKLVYWDTLAAARADLAMAVSVDTQPGELVPVAQRYADGRNYVKGFCWREDIERQRQKPLAPWMRVKLRSNTEAEGRREIMDRFGVMLARGQSSQVLPYVPEPLQAWELEKGYKRCWRIRGADGVSLKAKVNGVDYILQPDTFVDFSESRRPDKSLAIQVTLCRDKRLAAEEIPVELVYYREKK